MIVIEGQGTISVTEPGRDRGTYYEKAEIHIYGSVVHFAAYGKYHTASLHMCLIGWDTPPKVRETAGE
jgi:hypothetical protein